MVSEVLSARCATVQRLSWRRLWSALRGNALAAFPEAAFDEEVVELRLGGRRQFILNHPEAIRRVLIDNAGNYVRPAPALRVLRPIFGRGLFLSEGEEWRRQRRLAAAAFTPRAVDILVRHVAAAAAGLVAQLSRRDGPVDLVPLLQRTALDVIGAAMFSLEMATYGGEMRALISRYAARLGRSSLLDLLLPATLPSSRDLARRRFRRQWSDLVGRIIAERRRRGGDRGHGDLFDLLGAAPELPAGVLADQVATIVVAGHETTAAAMFWALYALAAAPVAQQRVADEAADLDLSAGGAAAALPRLVYTRAVVAETLRLYPPAFVIVRAAVADDVAGPIAVPARSLVLVAPWVLHRHRRRWCEPLRFDPTRFLPGAPAPERFSYLPFGAGPRTCIGAQFALAELTLMVAALTRAFAIGLTERRPVEPVAAVATQPREPPPFHLEPRGKSAAATLCQ